MTIDFLPGITETDAYREAVARPYSDEIVRNLRPGETAYLTQEQLDRLINDPTPGVGLGTVLWIKPSEEESMQEAPPELDKPVFTMQDISTFFTGTNKEGEQKILGFLYMLLATRSANMNISHRGMPTFSEHTRFVTSNPYLRWFIVSAGLGGVCASRIGTAYITHHNEVGIQLLPQWQGKGYGSEVMDYLEKTFGDKPLLANVSPDNLESQEFFQKRGYKLIQNTYRLDPKA